jgi:hypothetical protein
LIPRYGNIRQLPSLLLLSGAFDPNVADPVARHAILAALDRAGLSVKTALEVEVQRSPWETVLESAAGPN